MKCAAPAATASTGVVADKAGPHAQSLIRDAARQSFVDGWQQAMWAGVAVMAALFVYVLARGPQHPTDPPTPTPAREAIDAAQSR